MSLEIVGKYSNYRHILSDELEQRCKRNPHYSMRAFARDLEFNPPRLSEILAEKKGLSLGAAATICERLGFSQEETDYFCDLVLASDSRTASARRLALIRLKRYQSYERFELAEDVTRIIADWYHFAILELTDTDDFVPDPAWVAKALNLNPTVAKAAVVRLFRTGLLEEKDGTWQRGVDRVTTSHDVPSQAVREMTRSILEKSIVALETQSIQERDYSTITMAIDPEKLPEAKERITRFRRELAQFLESGARKKVYTLAIQLFRLSH